MAWFTYITPCGGTVSFHFTPCKVTCLTPIQNSSKFNSRVGLSNKELIWHPSNNWTSSYVEPPYQNTGIWSTALAMWSSIATGGIPKRGFPTLKGFPWSQWNPPFSISRYQPESPAAAANTTGELQITSLQTTYISLKLEVCLTPMGCQTILFHPKCNAFINFQYHPKCNAMHLQYHPKCNVYIFTITLNVMHFHYHPNCNAFSQPS